MRSLFQAKPELKGKMVVAASKSAYTSDGISLGKAAQTMSVSQEEMKDVIREIAGQIHLGPLTIDELKLDAANARLRI
jgi:predicted HTH domain antitoxin